MTGEYRFLRTRSGVTAFASVALASQPSTAWDIAWSESAAQLKRVYESAVEAGVRLAAHEHRRRGGKPESVTVVRLVETAADTKPDAVACAAAMAAWKAWGGSESEAKIVFDAGRWQVVFPKPVQEEVSSAPDPAL